MESILKIIDSLAKYSWAAFLVCLLLIVLPYTIAVPIGVAALKSTLSGFLVDRSFFLRRDLPLVLSFDGRFGYLAAQ